MRALLSTVLLLLAACGGGSPGVDASNVSASQPTGNGSNGGTGNNNNARLIAAMSMDVDIPSPAPNSTTGEAITLIRATVFIPEHREGDTYPLLLNSHGWGGDRMSRADVDANDPGTADSGENYFVLVERETETFWNNGYAVISWDERGFGRGDDGDNGTPDGAHGMSPDFEVRDAQAIIDWAVANLDLTMENGNDPLVGAFGGSYGGAFQLMLSAVDERVDAIVPSATWFDFELAVLPNGIIKKAYGHGLCLFAVADQAQLSTEVAQACTEGSYNATNREAADATPAAQAVFLENSLKAMAEAPGFSMPQVDALLLQGNRDILFNLTQAVRSFEFLTAAGGDVRLISHEDGHGIDIIRNGPGSQGPLGEAFCGNIDAVKTMLGWFDEKLKGQPSSNLPRICISLDDHTGVHLNSIPRGDANYRVSIGTTALSGNTHHNNDSVGEQAVFVSLASPIGQDDLILAGVPLAQLTINAGATNIDPTLASGPSAGLFIGVGIRRNGQLLLVDDQVAAYLSTDSRTGAVPETIELVAVGETLKQGDEVGVLLFGRHDQYENHTATPANTGTSWITNEVVVSGYVDLPILASTAGTIDQRPVPPEMRELCVANNCGTKTTVGTVPDAESAIFSDDGRLFVSGGTNVYEVTSDGTGGFDLTVISSATCNFSGMEIVGNVLYANCFDGATLWAGTIGQTVTLNPIYTYVNTDFANGLEVGPDGNLYSVNGPILAQTPRRIIKLTVDPNDPMSITAQEDWYTNVLSPNGLARIGNDFYFTDNDITGAGQLIKLPFNSDDGTAGSPQILFGIPGTVLDGVSVINDNQLLVASFSGGSVILSDTQGNIVSQTANNTFESASSAIVGRGPLFDDATLLVTEKGTVGEGSSNIGNRFSRFDP